MEIMLDVPVHLIPFVGIEMETVLITQFCWLMIRQRGFFGCVYDVKDTKAKFYKDYGDGNVSISWDKVTTFCNKQGEKLFKFGFAYNNVQLLEK